MSLVVSAFEAFDSLPFNPTASLLEDLLDDPPVPELVGLLLPVAYAEATELIESALDQHRPAGWIALGVHQGACAVVLERYAHNLDGAHPDNALEQREGQPIVPGGPAALVSTWPLDAILQELRDAGIPSVASSSAGHYLCNHALYRVLAGAERRRLPIVAGFVHLPLFPEQAAALEVPVPSLGRDLQRRAVSRIARAVVEAAVPIGSP